MCQPSTCEWVLARARVQVLQNSGSRTLVLRFTTLSARGNHLRNPRKKNWERSKIKSARVSALDGQWRAQCHAKWPRRDEGVQLSSGIEPKSPDSLKLTLINKSFVSIARKKRYDSSFFATCNQFFCVQDCPSRIVQVECQGQTRNTRILERKPLINTSYSILHRLEL